RGSGTRSFGARACTQVPQRSGLQGAGRPAHGTDQEATPMTAPDPVEPEHRPAQPTRQRHRSHDPQGRRALFETPVSAARDTIRSGVAAEGKDALYSTGPRQSGTVVVSCS